MIWFAVSAWGSMPELDRPTLCARAELAVVAEVTTVEPRWTAQGTIETHVWLAVDRAVRGSAPETIEVVTSGGTIGQLTHWVEHAPALVRDRRYLLLLAPIPGAWRVVGGELGAIALGADGEDEAAAVTSLGGCREAR